MAKAKTSPSWSDVKAKLQGFGQDGLVALIHDLYLASKDNRVFTPALLSTGRPWRRTSERSSAGFFRTSSATHPIRSPRPRRRSATTRRRQVTSSAWLS